jgi:LPXTG-site transpeptidase (sortase) family protein
VIGSRYKHRTRFTSQTCFMLSLEMVVLVFALWRMGVSVFPDFRHSAAPTSAPGVQALTRQDVLPTPTPDTSAPVRLIAFPGASMSAPVIPAGRIQGTWETRHLGDSVGHLVGTSWLDDPGGNIVLAGHVESYTGSPGPFAHLFEAKLGDLIILREGIREEHFRVTDIERVDPNDVSWLAQDGRRRLTLITCTEWDNKSRTYQGRLVVVAEPDVTTAQNSQ